MTYPKEPIGSPIIPGRLYLYMLDLPAGCKGGVYRVERFVQDVPTYTEKVLVHCIEGKDRGVWFVCSPANFAQRYQLLIEENGRQESAPPPAAAPERVVDLSSKGSF